MKRFALSLISSFLAFTAGLVTASSWNGTRRAVAIEPVVVERCPPGQQQVQAPVPPIMTEAPDREYPFAQGHLRLVPERVQLKSESMFYDIDVKYPQIVGGDTPGIRKINQHMKGLATQKYQWPLNVSKEAVRQGQEMLPGTFNSVNLDYEVSVATDSFLSIFFMGYSYGVGAAHAVQESEAVNYDLTSGRQLNLSDLFKPGAKYLKFISDYCTEELTRGIEGAEPFQGALAPVAKNFESWHITTSGISFNFDACKVFPCAEGEQAVEIPFGELEPLLNPGIPGKFKITYP